MLTYDASGQASLGAVEIESDPAADQRLRYVPELIPAAPNPAPRLEAIEMENQPASGARRDVGLPESGTESDTRPYLEQVPQ